jgi:hypothetical protein
MRILRYFSFALLTLLLARAAHAQFTGAAPAGFGSLNISTVAGASDSAKGDTPGVKVSDTLYLHAGLAVGVGVDSNVFYQDTGTTSSAVSHVMPQLSLTNAARGVQPPYQLNLVVNGDYRQYFSDKVVDTNRAAFGVGVGANLDILSVPHWGFTLFDNFYRDVQPPYEPETLEFTRDIEQGGLRLRWQPGGGRLEEMLQYYAMYDHFEEQTLSLADSLTHAIEFRSAFKFLPKTAFYIDINQMFIRYLNTMSGKVDSNPFRATAGLTGLITTKLTLGLSAGYGNGFYTTGPNPSVFIATAEVGYLIGPFAKAKLGYEHDFSNSLFGNYYDLDAVYAGWNQQVGRAFLAGLTLRWEHRDYHCDAMTGMTAAISCFNDPTGGDRVDNWVGLNLQANYFPQPWFSLGAQYQLLANVTDFAVSTGGGPTVNARFVKHQVLGVLSLTY